MITIDGQRSFLIAVSEYLKFTKISDAQLCRLSGLSANTLYNLRKYPNRGIGLKTFVAITQAMNMKITLERELNNESLTS
jgi:hypothetical protein